MKALPKRLTPTNEPRTKVVISLPADGADRLIKKWNEKDPALMAELERLGVIDIKLNEYNEDITKQTDAQD